MGIFSNVSDVSGQLKAEGLNMTLNWTPGVPNAGQGTISWNIPGPVEESLDANGNAIVTATPTGQKLVYSGIVIVLRIGKPVDETNIPRNGHVYVADPTADPNMFTGDTIGEHGMVIGAFYEGQIKAQGGALTTNFVINDVDPETPYYICGYIVDDQNNYYVEGIRAYSEKFGLTSERGTPARQVVQLRQIPGITGNVSNVPLPPTAPGPVRYGVKPTDGTGLLAGATYQFELIYDNNFPHPNEKSISRMFFSFDGGLTPTYADLVKYLNQQIAIKCHNAVQSPLPPSSGIYYWNATTKVLYQWNGSELTVIKDIVVQATDPTEPTVGSYWWNTTNNLLYVWNGLQYQLVEPQFAYPTDPTQLNGTGYWWNGLNGFTRCGNTWCETTTFNQTTDPSCPIAPVNCAYWYDTANSTLYNWNGSAWDQAYALMWTSAPNALPTGTEWFNLANNQLSVRSSIGPIATFNSPVGGGGYVQGTYNGVSLIGGHGTGATANIVVSGDEIASVNNLVGGTGYNSFIAQTFTSVPLTGGNGSGAQATISVVDGIVTSVTITAPGTGYAINDTLSADAASIGGFQRGPIATLGSFTSGSGYTNGTYTNVPLTDGFGTGAQATIVVTGSAVTSVTLTNGGSRYADGSVLIDSTGVLGAGSGFNVPVASITSTAFSVTVATLAGSVSSVTLANAGTGYTVNDVLTCVSTDLGSNTGAGFTVSVATLAASPTNTWIQQQVIVSSVDPTTVSTDTVVAGTWWYNTSTETLSQRNSQNTSWTAVPVLVWSGDPTNVQSCEIWWDESTDPATLFQWDFAHSTWNAVSAFYQQATDPFGAPTLATGTLWWNPTTQALLLWNGSSWTVIPYFNMTQDPTNPQTGWAWLNTTTNTWNIWGTPLANKWNAITPTTSATNPAQPAQGSFWFDTTTSVLYQRVGLLWIPIPYVTTAPSNFKGQQWFNLTTNQLNEWNGNAWIPVPPCAFVRLERGELIFETTGRGSKHTIFIPIPYGAPNNPSTCVTINTGQVDYVNDSNSPYQNYPLGGFGNSYPCSCMFETGSQYGRIKYPTLNINPKAFLFSHLTPMGSIPIPQVGRDGVDGTPTYAQLGVGTTGNPGPRRELMKEVRALLGDSGSQVVTVELDDVAMDTCVENALKVFRMKSSLAVKRAAFMLDIVPYRQNYILADKAVGFNKIVSVMAGYRFTSAFLSSAMGAGVYGQVVLQHLYNMGTFDLLSYHLVSQYVENLEILFSTRLVFVFDEASRELQIFEAFNRPERVLLDVVVEKTEQEIFTNRYASRWIQQYALAEACDMLANIRGKYGNLPGAGGSVSLNASDLRSQAQDIRTKCQEEIDDYTVQNVEDFGAYGSIAIG